MNLVNAWCEARRVRAYAIAPVNIDANIAVLSR
jgi:hypothetical protein